jgi:ribosomal protein L19E
MKNTFTYSEVKAQVRKGPTKRECATLGRRNRAERIESEARAMRRRLKEYRAA